MEVPAGLERSVTKTAAMPFVAFWPAEGELPTWARTLTPGGATAANRNMFIRARIAFGPCCTAACICPQTRHSLAHTCAPRRLQPLLIVCSCFAEKTEVAHRLQFSVVTSNPDGRSGPPASRRAGSLLFNAASARAIRSNFTWEPRCAAECLGLKSHPRSSSEPANSGAFSLASHTRRCEAWRMRLAKHVYRVDLSSRFVPRSRLFEVNLGSSRQSRERGPAFAFLYFKKADYSAK